MSPLTRVDETFQIHLLGYVLTDLSYRSTMGQAAQKCGQNSEYRQIWFEMLTRGGFGVAVNESDFYIQIFSVIILKKLINHVIKHLDLVILQY